VSKTLTGSRKIFNARRTRLPQAALSPWLVASASIAAARRLTRRAVLRPARIVEDAARKRDRDNVWNWQILLQKLAVIDDAAQPFYLG
jgi:hypothetical protein